MDSHDANRIGAAILLTALAVAGSAWMGRLAVPAIIPPRPAFALPEPPGGAAGPSLADALAHADPRAGQLLAARTCAICHSFTRGAPPTVGPNLSGVAGTPIADVPGYVFSPALSAHRSEFWTDDALATWLESPARFAPGTRMAFPGLPDIRDRAAIIAYLHTLSDGGRQP
ncbi:c-type cytochrome [Gluconacetobacter sacchari]|uniref:C-type cytochrome n=2 Tax=Gluconacetobacter sacchari TaxID=92759 RepID=A0A7W4IA30_9PROT|nr:c-type cytochrome [Gluconacetobacter sacchari]MBB2159069.1 c-type cytochrome [Gluconacetobacter sacchari]GBQ31640.1 cytochrome c [Gluconacetobacter sacchari DSM 12717]